MSSSSITRRAFAGLLAAAPAALPQRPEKLTISAIEAWPVRLVGEAGLRPPRFEGPYDPQRWRWRGPFAQLTSAIIVAVRTDQGIVGYGLGAGGAAATTIIEGHLKHLLLGMDPRDTELLWRQMYSAAEAYGRGGVFVMALSGVDNALWDVAGKAAGQPVYRMLGGSLKETAPSYFTSANPAKGLELGFEHFKLPIRDGVFEGREGMQRIEDLLREARQTIGPERGLMIDCGSRWHDLAYTKEMARRLEDVRLDFIEEPLSPDDILGYAELVREIDTTQIASGEHEYTEHGFQMLFHHNAVEVVQPDVSWCGGVTALRRIAAMAHARNLPFIPHRGGSAYGLPLVLSSPSSPLAESFGTGDPAATDLMLAMTPRFENGFYFPSEKPGFGTELTEELVRQHAR